ncbi:J domain-containing protein [Sediminitomix flava]|uniref:DnaJ-like protein n=1 Tax=Sediminitomix flava TaxID=379075 RepID=A0A315ZF46_SEDFL|nr:DnaJ domain-containing protein [Sediminitomix flava]PWJ43952.1 DnaJ-like protein [Sediminitomix flava]
MIINRLKDILRAELSDRLTSEDSSLKDWFEKAGLSWEESQTDYQKYADEYDKYYKSSSSSSSQQQSQYQQYNTSSSSASSKDREYYAALEIPYGSSFAVVKKAYKKMIRVYHPDLYHNQPEKQDIAQKVTRKINEAYNHFEQKEKNK